MGGVFDITTFRIARLHRQRHRIRGGVCSPFICSAFRRRDGESSGECQRVQHHDHDVRHNDVLPFNKNTGTHSRHTTPTFMVYYCLQVCQGAETIECPGYQRL